MTNVKLPIAVCAAVAEILVGSHDTLNALFETAGAPGPPPELAHHSKWKTWLQRVGNDPKVNSLEVLGNLIEEFMDLPPASINHTLSKFLAVEMPDPVEDYLAKKSRLVSILEEHGFRYFRGGRVIQIGQYEPIDIDPIGNFKEEGQKPSTIDELLRIVIMDFAAVGSPWLPPAMNTGV